ncbi:MAG: hypothetical protein HY897_09105 [Deltaproteobacteria bacterium]|nr:hypothetical protein [Deltaproteobacteria bacterium]
MKSTENKRATEDCGHVDDVEDNTFETVATAIAVTVALLVCALTSADACAAEGGASAAPAPKCLEVRPSNGTREFFCPPEPITGKVGLPGTFVIPRQKVEIPGHDLDERHAPKIVEAAKKEPL